MPDSRQSSEDVLQRLREQRREILKSLPANDRAKLRRLNFAIKSVLAVMAEQPAAVPQPPTRPRRGFLFPEQLEALRVPLFKQREKLIEFLKGREPATRGEIIAATSIPSGTLSTLLKNPKDFRQVRHGYWTLKK